MEEIESPVESLSEEIHHIAEHAKDNWLKLAALLSALLAVLGAIAGMEAGHEVNEAMIKQIQASDGYSFYQAKGIKSMILENLPQPTDEAKQKIERYKSEQTEIKKEADEKAEAAEHHLKLHEILARAVTLFQVAIALTAISVLTRRKGFLLFSGALGLIGGVFFAQYWLL